jgi:hypothetical protein
MAAHETDFSQLSTILSPRIYLMALARYTPAIALAASGKSMRADRHNAALKEVGVSSILSASMRRVSTLVKPASRAASATILMDCHGIPVFGANHQSDS